MKRFVGHLAQLCAAHPARAKWVVVPTRAAGRMLGDHLVLEGTNWANLRFVTPFDLALRMGAPFLVERGINPNEEGLGPALVMRLLIGLPEASSYFRPQADQPRLAMALWSTLRELRLADVSASDLKAALLPSTVKRDELAALLAAYEAFLADGLRGDRATVFSEALRHVDWCPIAESDCWTTFPDVVWPRLERRLIDQLPGERIDAPRVVVDGGERPRRLAQQDSAAPAVTVDIAPGARDRVQFFTAGGFESEVEEVFRRILASGVRIDDVEVACGASAYAPMVWEKACRYDWPVTLAGGLPATLTRPGRALLAFAEWIDDDFSAGRLRRMFESGDVHLSESGDRIVAPGQAARLLLKARASWGRRTYHLAFTRLVRAERARTLRDDIDPEVRERHLARAADAEVVGRLIDEMVALVPEEDDQQTVDLQRLVAGARAFLERQAVRANTLDTVAATALSGALAELVGLGSFRCRLSEGLRFIRERVESLTVGADRARPAHLYVSSLSHLGISGRSHVYIVGLEEGRVFPPSFEDPILLDEERQAIDTTLAVSTDRTDEAVHGAVTRLADLLASSKVRLCLSYSCRDTREFRETYASWVLLQVYRQVSGQPGASFKTLHEHLGTAVSVVSSAQDARLGPGRWWLATAARSDTAVARAAVFARFPALAAGAEAGEARESEHFTAWDGHVPAAGPVLDPAASGAIVSPTRLEGIARCPYRHFLEYGLGVRAIETGERAPDAWLDPLIRGSLLHDLYAVCLRRVRAEGRRVSLSADRDWLRHQARQRLVELAAEMPAPSADVERRETDELLEDLDLFVHAEETLDPARRPFGFEVSFGDSRAADDGGESLASRTPVEIPVGSTTLRLTGRVDRIDRIDGPAGSSFQIVDYKTGSFWRDEYRGTFAGGRLLQHALYGLAVSELLRRASLAGAVTGAEYYFAAAKGMGHRHRIDRPTEVAIAAVLNDLRDVVLTGTFVHAHEKQKCKFCEYQHACGRRAHEQSTRKQQDALLEAWRRLSSHV